MADYGSDIDEDLLEEVEQGDELEDRELAGEIDAAISADVDYELVDAPEDDDVENPEENESGDIEDAIIEIIDGEQKTVEPECKIDDNALGETTIDNTACTKRDMIQFREMGIASDSRMPDIPTTFELCGLIISRACTLVANSPPKIPYDVFDPEEIARRELIQGKALRAVMRNDTRWRWSDFTCFPRGFMNSDETADSLHMMH